MTQKQTKGPLKWTRDHYVSGEPSHVSQSRYKRTAAGNLVLIKPKDPEDIGDARYASSGLGSEFSKSVSSSGTYRESKFDHAYLFGAQKVLAGQQPAKKARVENPVASRSNRFQLMGRPAFQTGGLNVKVGNSVTMAHIARGNVADSQYGELAGQQSIGNRAQSKSQWTRDSTGSLAVVRPSSTPTSLQSYVRKKNGQLVRVQGTMFPPPPAPGSRATNQVRQEQPSPCEMPLPIASTSSGNRLSESSKTRQGRGSRVWSRSASAGTSSLAPPRPLAASKVRAAGPAFNKAAYKRVGGSKIILRSGNRLWTASSKEPSTSGGPGTTVLPSRAPAKRNTFNRVAPPPPPPLKGHSPRDVAEGAAQAQWRSSPATKAASGSQLVRVGSRMCRVIKARRGMTWKLQEVGKPGQSPAQERSGRGGLDGPRPRSSALRTLRVPATAPMAASGRRQSTWTRTAQASPPGLARSRAAATLQRVQARKSKAAVRGRTPLCPSFCRSGFCSAHAIRRCKLIHDPSKVTVCPKWLQGSCSSPTCRLQHKMCPDVMPVCAFYLRGMCTSENCPYLHVRYAPGTPVCAPFLKNCCPNGALCPHQHVTKKMAREMASDSAPKP